MKLLVLVNLLGDRIPDWLPAESLTATIDVDDDDSMDVLRARLHDAANSLGDYLDMHREKARGVA